MMDLNTDDFDKFVGVLARFTVASYVTHLTASEGRVTNEHGATAIDRMLSEVKLPATLMGKEHSHALLHFGGKDRFKLVWDTCIKEACAPLPPALQTTVLARFTALKTWHQVAY